MSFEREQRIIELEAQTHEGFTPWVNAHVAKSGGRVIDIGYDREAYPYQRLDTPLLPPKDKYKNIPLAIVPNKLVMNGMKRKLNQQLGAGSLKSMVNVLHETPARLGSDTSVIEELKILLDEKQRIALINDHLESGDYRDVALAIGTINLALGHKKYRKKLAAVLGLNISRQAMGTPEAGYTPVADLVTEGMGIIWVMQNTDNRNGTTIPREADSIVNDGAKAAMEELGQEGCLVGIVPGGSATGLVSERGHEYYLRPSARPAVPTLMSFDEILPFAIKGGEILPGPFISPEGDDRKSRMDMVERSLAQLALNSALLTQTPVVFEDLSKRKMIASSLGHVKPFEPTRP